MLWGVFFAWFLLVLCVRGDGGEEGYMILLYAKEWGGNSFLKLSVRK